MTSQAPYFSIVIPAFNAARYLPRVIAGLENSTFRDFEVLLVDDGSVDETASLATAAGFRVIANDSGQRGPGGARNEGSRHALGDILLFLDADVVVHPDTISQVAAVMRENPDVAAVFGSYDNAPADRHVVSSFKNLMHHYVHQQGQRDAVTFWTGCGAIRTEVFRQLGGFLPTTLFVVEDLEYGHRLNDAGYRVQLLSNIQVKHLKRWTLKSLVYTDVCVRAIPWTLMMLRRGKADKDLNFTGRHKLSAVIALLILPLLYLGFFLAIASPWLGFGHNLPHYQKGLLALIPAMLALMIFLGLNLAFYRFLFRCRGLLFAVACIPVHLIYYHYSAFGYVAALSLHGLGLNRENAPDFGAVRGIQRKF